MKEKLKGFFKLKTKEKLRWIFGVGAIIAIGIPMIFKASFLGGLSYIIFGLIITPKTGSIIFQKLSIVDNKKAKYGLLIGFWILGLFFGASGGDKGAADDLKKVEEFLKNEKFDEAIRFVKQNSEKHEFATDFKYLDQRIERALDNNYQINEIRDMSDEEIELLFSNNLEKKYFKSEALNNYYLNQLFSKKEEGKTARDVKRGYNKVKSDFNMSGEHKPTKELILSKMNNPENYEFEYVYTIGGLYQKSNKLENMGMKLTGKLMGMDVDFDEMKKRDLSTMEGEFGKIGDRYFFEMYFFMMSDKERKNREKKSSSLGLGGTISTATVVLDPDGSISFVRLVGVSGISKKPWKGTNKRTLELKF